MRSVSRIIWNAAVSFLFAAAFYVGFRDYAFASFSEMPYIGFILAYFGLYAGSAYVFMVILHNELSYENPWEPLWNKLKERWNETT